jgi:transposase
MVGVSKAISDELFEKVKLALSETSRSGDVSRKLQAIKSAKEHGITAVSKIFDVSRVAIMDWIAAFKEGGVEGLKIKPGRGRKSIITKDEVAKIRKWFEEDCNLTIHATQCRIESTFGKKLGKSATHNLIRSLGLSYITPRPKHHKQDATTHEAFKKKSSTRDAKKT